VNRWCTRTMHRPKHSVKLPMIELMGVRMVELKGIPVVELTTVEFMGEPK
jgi:hypothetical protein